MNSARRRGCRGFTLVEIMIVVAIIGMLAALMLPGIAKIRKQSEAKRIVNDARVIDTAVNAWALENGKVDGDPVDIAALGSYTKAGAVATNDVLGNPYTIGPVGTNQVQISQTTKDALSGVSVDWGAY